MLSGCTTAITLTNFDDGEVLVGECNEINEVCIITLKNGEIMSGKYSKVSSGRLPFGTNTCTRGNSYPITGFRQGIMLGAGQAYALLKSDRSPLIMEILVNYGFDGSGFGESRTNTGRAYKVQLD